MSDVRHGVTCGHPSLLSVSAYAWRVIAVGIVTTGLVASSLFSAPSPASADAAGEQVWETGTIRHVSDGDTVAVDVTWAANPGFIAPPAGAGRTYCSDRIDPDGTMPDDGKLDDCRVRMIGIQAPETASHSPTPYEQCKASAATDTLKRLLPKGTPVQLRSLSSTSADPDHSGGRLTRAVYYQDRSGQWVDAARAVFQRGEAMWFPFNGGDAESAHNLEYRRLVDAAAAARVGLWSDSYCGPSGPASVRTWAVTNPIGSDSGNEYAVLLNEGAAPLDVSGWTVRDTSLIWMSFPPGTVIPPGDFVRVWSGRGTPRTPTHRDHYFGGGAMMFSNWDPSAGYFFGDAVYVYDTQPGYAYGNLRSWFHYPCDGASCADPLRGRITFGEIMYDPPGADTAAAEYVDIRNVSAAPAHLGGYAFGRQGGQFPFPPGTVIPAGGTLRVSIGTGQDTASTVHLGRSSRLLANSGDLLTIENLNHASVDCRAWGGFTCAGHHVTGSSAATQATPSPAPEQRATTVATKPGAPVSVSATSRKRRLTVSWSAPESDGGAAVTKYRVKVYKKKGKRLKRKARCYARNGALSCRTKKLKRRKTYVVRVQARNRQGYGPAAPSLSVRVR